MLTLQTLSSSQQERDGEGEQGESEREREREREREVDRREKTRLETGEDKKVQRYKGLTHHNYKSITVLKQAEIQKRKTLSNRAYMGT